MRHYNTITLLVTWSSDLPLSFSHSFLGQDSLQSSDLWKTFYHHIQQAALSLAPSFSQTLAQRCFSSLGAFVVSWEVNLLASRGSVRWGDRQRQAISWHPELAVSSWTMWGCLGIVLKQAAFSVSRRGYAVTLPGWVKTLNSRLHLGSLVVTMAFYRGWFSSTPWSWARFLHRGLLPL